MLATCLKGSSSGSQQAQETSSAAPRSANTASTSWHRRLARALQGRARGGLRRGRQLARRAHRARRRTNPRTAQARAGVASSAGSMRSAACGCALRHPESNRGSGRPTRHGAYGSQIPLARKRPERLAGAGAAWPSRTNGRAPIFRPPNSLRQSRDVRHTPSRAYSGRTAAAEEP